MLELNIWLLILILERFNCEYLIPLFVINISLPCNTEVPMPLQRSEIQVSHVCLSLQIVWTDYSLD